MTDTWDLDAPGVAVLPSGRAVRGRALRGALPSGPTPEFGLYLLAREPPAVEWAYEWLRWSDFWLPSDMAAAQVALRDLWSRSAHQRVELACGGGRGRTGTALACVAIIDGVPASEAVAYIREHFDRRAVETPWQRRFVARFNA